MLRIITLNLNGVRSAWSKGFAEWLAIQQADVVCLQELKAHTSDLTPAMLAPAGYSGHFHCAQKRGYSGVGIYHRLAPSSVSSSLGVDEFDCEGRWIRADFNGYSVISVYLPSGSSSPERQEAKFRFLEIFHPLLAALMQESRSTGREFIICGDWNIAHKEIDLKNWKSNQKNSGFLPQERTWLSGVFDQLGWVDVFRCLDASPDRYTWWSNRGQAWAKNVGWRIDYQIATPRMAAAARSANIHIASRFSDHAPLTIDYDWPSTQ